MDTTDAPQLIEHVNHSVNFTPNDTKWIPGSARFVAMGIYPKATGALTIFGLNQGELKTHAVHEKTHGIKCGTFGASTLEDRHLATGDYGGVMSGPGEGRRPVYSAQAHKSIVNAIDGCGGQNIGSGAPEIVTGGRDGCIRVWDEQDTARDCWTVCFGNSYNDVERCVVGGYDNGDIKMFDLRTNSLRWETNCQNGVVNLLVTTLESKFRVYDLRTFHPEQGFSCMTEKAHKSTIWQGRFLPQNRDLFMTGGGNGGFNFHYPLSRTAKDSDGRLYGVCGSVELLNSRVLSTQPIVSMDWSPDREGLCTLACLDQTVRVYIVTKTNKY
ncbi:WD40-repeat-containing domain [Phytophthora cactorum]|nr:WD40-repeat-containing domain [Phytophthora cactorum]